MKEENPPNPNLSLNVIMYTMYTVKTQRKIFISVCIKKIKLLLYFSMIMPKNYYMIDVINFYIQHGSSKIEHYALFTVK